MKEIYCQNHFKKIKRAIVVKIEYLIEKIPKKYSR